MEGQVETSGQTGPIDDGAAGVHRQHHVDKTCHRHAAEPHADGVWRPGWCALSAAEAASRRCLRLAESRAKRSIRTREHERIDRLVPRLPVRLQGEPLREQGLEPSGSLALQGALRSPSLYVEPI